MKMTTAQARAVETNARYVCVDAGAGSGKTRVLIERIVQRLEARACTLDQVVAITFTEKAALEMKERLRAECRKRSAAAVDDPNDQTFWRIQERATDAARITTIHSFCMALVKEHALRLGLDPDFAILEDTDSHLLLRDTVESQLRAMYDEGFEPALHTAAEYGGANLAKIMVDLVANHRSVVRPWWTANGEKSASDLVEAWRTEVDAFNERQLRFLQRHPQLAALCAEVSALSDSCSDPTDRRSVFREKLEAILTGITNGSAEEVGRALAAVGSLNAQGGSRKKWRSESAFNRPKEIRDELKAICAEHELIEFDPIREANAARLTLDLAKVFDRVESAFQEAKQRINAADFDDLIFEAYRILRDHDAIRESVASDIRHLFVDEFQDTDSIQYEIVSLLASASPNLCRFIVGDAKQSIYLFRGAEVDVFQRARGEAEEGIVLDTNFRSLPGVFQFINEFFTHSKLLTAVEPEYNATQVSREPVASPCIEFLVPDIIPKEDDNSMEAYRRTEANLIAARIAAMCDPASGIVVHDPATGTLRTATYGDVALLFRSFSNVPLYERALREADVPFNVISGTGYYERQEVMDLRNMLTVVADPWNEMALIAVLRGPFIGVTDETLFRLRRLESASVAQAFYGGGRTGDAHEDQILDRGRTLIADLRARSEMGPAALVRYVLDRTQFEATLLAQFLGLQKASNVRKVLELAESYSRGHAPSLPAFLRVLQEAAAEKIREGEAVLQAEDNQSVALMTVHKAKGLEFPIVFVPDMTRKAEGHHAGNVLAHRKYGLAARTCDDRGESDSSAMYQVIDKHRKQADREESARVLYVALTRARDYLVMSGAPEAAAATWFGPMADRWNILAATDGTTIAGAGWQATVRRTVARVAGGFSRVSRPAPDPAQRSRARPLECPRIDQGSWRATALAAVLAGAPVDDVARTVSRVRGYKMEAGARGDCVHRFFELIQRHVPHESAAAMIAREAGMHGAERQALVADLTGMVSRFDETLLARLMRDGGPIALEVPFTLRINQHVIHGTADAVLADGTLIDYKTGAFNPQTHAKYEWQLRIYALAYRLLRGAAPPAAYLCYVDLPPSEAVVAVEINDAILDETLRRIEAQLAIQAAS